MSTKKLTTIVALTIMAGVVYAAPTTVKAIADGAPLSPAYEFKVTSGSLGIYTVGQSFRTFCLEAGETFANGVTYYAEVIHYIEGERASLSDNIWSSKASELLTEANESGWTTIGNVRVVNLWTSYDPQTKTYSGYAQDQLVLVPAPGALLLASIGMAVVGGLRRRQSV